MAAPYNYLMHKLSTRVSQVVRINGSFFATLLPHFFNLNFRYDKRESTWINQLSHSLQQYYLPKIIGFDKILVYPVYLFCPIISYVNNHSAINRHV